MFLYNNYGNTLAILVANALGTPAFAFGQTNEQKL